jgi:hypothetical protein
MKHHRAISTAVLFLLLGTTLPAFAQKGENGKGGDKGQGKGQQVQHQAQPQARHQAQPQHAQHQQPKHTQQVQRRQPPQSQRGQSVADNRGNNGFHGNGNNGNHYGRISDDHYRASFGNEHSFHMIRPRMIDGYNRFQYGGYWFGYNQGWPSGWSYDDNVYVVYDGGGYYMYNQMHPGIHISLNIF